MKVNEKYLMDQQPRLPINHEVSLFVFLIRWTEVRLSGFQPYQNNP